MSSAAAPIVTVEAPPQARLTRGRRRFAWLTVPAGISLTVIVGWFVVAITVPWWTPYNPVNSVGTALTGPSWQHLLGTDELGRDVLTRTLYGARQSLPLALVVIVVSVSLGCLVGAASGFLGRWVDAVLMRLADVTFAFPAILLAMIVTASLGPGLNHIAIAIIAVWWPGYARLLRGQILTVKEQLHVEAARAVGVGPLRLLRVHILPLSMAPVLVNATMDMGQIVLFAAGLSFIGLGAVPPTPEWGLSINEGAGYFYQWWIALGPGVAILSVALAFNFLGDALRDAFDVRQKAR